MNPLPRVPQSPHGLIDAFGLELGSPRLLRCMFHGSCFVGLTYGHMSHMEFADIK